MTSESQEGGSGHIAGVCSQCTGFYDVCSTSDASAGYQGHIIADTFITQPLIDSRKGKFNRDSYIVTDSGRSSARTSAETVNCNDIRAASCDSACNGSNIMDSGNFNNNRLFIFGGFF